jgi:hypothetical protein
MYSRKYLSNSIKYSQLEMCPEEMHRFLCAAKSGHPLPQ